MNCYIDSIKVTNVIELSHFLKKTLIPLIVFFVIIYIKNSLVKVGYLQFLVFFIAFIGFLLLILRKIYNVQITFFRGVLENNTKEFVKQYNDLIAISPIFWTLEKVSNSIICQFSLMLALTVVPRFVPREYLLVFNEVSAILPYGFDFTSLLMSFLGILFSFFIIGLIKFLDPLTYYLKFIGIVR